MKNVTTRIYGRFSSKPQERGDSKRQQVDGAKDYAKKNGLAHTLSEDIYFDEGVSGKAGLNLEREFGRLIQDSNEGDNILVMFADRIGRQNPFLTGKLIYDITQKGVNVIVWGEGRTINRENINDLGTQLGVFTGNAISHGDNQRRIKRANDVNTETLKLASAGTPTRNLLKYLPSCYYWNDTIKKFDFDKDKAKTIRLIYSEFLAGKGTTTICNELNESKTPCLSDYNKSNRWVEVTVKQILRNESYAGVCIPKKANDLKITCFPPIIKKEVFEKAQLLLVRFRNRHGNSSKKGRVNNIFPYLIKCSVCGGDLTVAMTNTKDGRKRPSYQYFCRNAKYKLCKVHSRRSVRPIEVFIMAALSGGAGESLAADNQTPNGDKIVSIETQINKLNTAMENLYDLAEAGDRMAKERIAKRKQELTTLEAELKQIIAANKDYAIMPSLIEEIGQMFKSKDVTKGVAAMKDYFFTVWQRLQDNELRKRLYVITPSIIESINVDLENNRYCVTKKGDAANGSKWIDVENTIADIKAKGFKWDERIHHAPRKKKVSS